MTVVGSMLLRVGRRLVVLLMALGTPSVWAQPECVGWTEFSSFSHARDEASGESVWTSPMMEATRPFREVILSWNMNWNWSGLARFEVASVEPSEPIRFYELGWWASDSREGRRRSVKNQKDDRGEVRTDTLVLRKPCRRFQVRIRLDGKETSQVRPPVRLLVASLSNEGAARPPQQGRDAGGGRPMAGAHEISEVPRLCQLDYPGGEVWCSPTSVTMILRHWARKQGRPDLDLSVPSVAAEAYDPAWPGTGNWSFNMAFAGSLPGMRAYVTRLKDLEELWAWTSNGVPVAASVCYNRLKQSAGPTSGHLVVCVGRDSNGSVIVYDPGSRLESRRIVLPEAFLHAWAHSSRTVYLIHPEGQGVPMAPERRWLEK